MTTRHLPMDIMVRYFKISQCPLRGEPIRRRRPSSFNLLICFKIALFEIPKTVTNSFVVIERSCRSDSRIKSSVFGELFPERIGELLFELPDDELFGEPFSKFIDGFFTESNDSDFFGWEM